MQRPIPCSAESMFPVSLCAFCNPRHKDLRFHVVFLATWAPELPACFSSVSPARLGSLVAWLLLWWDHLGIQNSLVPVYTKKVTWGLDIIGPPGWGQPCFAVTLQSSHVLLMLMPCHLPSRASKQRCLCDVFVQIFLNLIMHMTHMTVRVFRVNVQFMVV